ncbi:hypothetical protein [Mesorhizobium sp. A556]
MPREAIVPDDTHREEQRRYRERLRIERVPEVGMIDTAVAVGVYAFLRKLSTERRRSKALDEVLQGAVVALARMGYDSLKVERVLRRRLVGKNSRFERLVAGSRIGETKP